MIWRYGGQVAKIPQQNLAWIHAILSEKPELTNGKLNLWKSLHDCGRKMNACAMTVATADKESSRAIKMIARDLDLNF